MHRTISELYTKRLCPVESLHLFCRLLIFHFRGGNMPFLGWPRWHILCTYLSAVLGDPGSPPGKLQESTSVPDPPGQWLWAVPPLCWARIIRQKMDHVFFSGTSPHLALWLVCVTQYGTRALCIVTWRVQHSQVTARDVPCAQNSYTMVEDVIQCPEMLPLPPLPTCQNKYLIWKSRYRSQLDCTKGPVSFLLLLLLFF